MSVTELRHPSIIEIKHAEDERTGSLNKLPARYFYSITVDQNFAKTTFKSNDTELKVISGFKKLKKEAIKETSCTN